MLETSCTFSQHIKRAALRDFNAKSAEVLCEVGAKRFEIFSYVNSDVNVSEHSNSLILFPLQLRYDLPKLYKFHKRKEVDIVVDLWRFEPRQN